jgi:hypothetical protein
VVSFVSCIEIVAYHQQPQDLPGPQEVGEVWRPEITSRTERSQRDPSGPRYYAVANSLTHGVQLVHIASVRL